MGFNNTYSYIYNPTTMFKLLAAHKYIIFCVSTDVVLAVLNLLYMFSKRSNFITRLGQEKRAGLLTRLTHLAASWGGKDNGFGLSKCCTDDPIHTFPGILNNSQTNVLSIYLENGTYETVSRSPTWSTNRP